MKLITILFFLFIPGARPAIDLVAQEIDIPVLIVSIQWSPRSDLLLVSGKTENEQWGVWFYNEDFEMIYFYPTENSVSTYWSPDGSKVALGRNIVDSETFDIIVTLNAESGIGGWNEDGTQVLAYSDSEANQLALFDARTGELVRIVELGEIMPDAVSWSPDRKYFVRLLPTGESEIISAADGSLVTTIDIEYPIGLRWSPDSRYLAAGAITDAEPDTPNILPYAASPTMASVIVWEAISGNVVQTFSGLQGAPLILRWHPHRPEIVAATGEGLIYIWNLKTGEELTSMMTLPALTVLEYSPFGGRLIIGSWLARQAFHDSIPPLSTRRPLWKQVIIPDEFEAIVPLASIERLNTAVEACVTVSEASPSNLEALSTQPLASVADLPSFIEQIEALPSDALPTGCTDDLLALAAALQTP